MFKSLVSNFISFLFIILPRWTLKISLIVEWNIIHNDTCVYFKFKIICMIKFMAKMTEVQNNQEATRPCVSNISLNKLSGHSLNLSLSVCLAVYTKLNHTTHKHSASSAQPLEPCTFTGISPHFSPEDPAYTGKIWTQWQCGTTKTQNKTTFVYFPNYLKRFTWRRTTHWSNLWTVLTNK